jgi:hypothetical protein
MGTLAQTGQPIWSQSDTVGGVVSRVERHVVVLVGDRRGHGQFGQRCEATGAVRLLNSNSTPSPSMAARTLTSERLLPTPVVTSAFTRHQPSLRRGGMSVDKFVPFGDGVARRAKALPARTSAVRTNA